MKMVILQLFVLHWREVRSGRHMSVLQMLIFFYILTIQDVRSGGTLRAKEHMKKPDLDDTEVIELWRGFPT